MRDRIFYIICFGFLLGVFLRSFVSVNLYLALWLGFIAFFVIIFHFFISKSNWGIIAGIFILSFAFGILRFYSVDKPAPEIFESQIGQKVTFEGVIVDEPSIRPNDQQLVVSISIPDVGGKIEKTEIVISAGLDQSFKYGDEINFTGKLKKPENFLTDQGKTFDYMNYLRKDGIFYVMSYPQIEIVSHGHGSAIKSALFAAKDKFLDKINFLIPSPESIFMGGLILGEKSAFDQTLKQQFVNTGTIHVVALSGYNVTIVAQWIMEFLSIFTFIPKNFGIGVGIFAIILFILMTGGSSTTIVFQKHIARELELDICCIG